MASLLIKNAKGLVALGVGAAGLCMATQNGSSWLPGYGAPAEQQRRRGLFVRAHAQPHGDDRTKKSDVDTPTSASANRDEVPGREKTWTTSALEKGAGIVQNLQPIKQIHQHLCGFHFYAHDMNRQVEAHHYCSHINEDVIQCVIYDSDAPNARLIGIEYVISEPLFLSLPDEEKKLWHSHEHEIKGGILVAPGLPTAVENKKMEQLARTYGKTWHTWQVDRGDKIPMGPPALMMGFTADGQMHPHLLEGRDAKYGISTEERKKQREYIQGLQKGPHRLADFWKTGKGWATVIKEVPFRSYHDEYAERNR